MSNLMEAINTQPTPAFLFGVLIGVIGMWAVYKIKREQELILDIVNKRSSLGYPLPEDYTSSTVYRSEEEMEEMVAKGWISDNYQKWHDEVLTPWKKENLK